MAGLGVAVGSGVMWALGQILKGFALKVLVMTAIWTVLAVVVPYLISLLPDYMDGSSITDLFAKLPDGVFWFLNLVNFNHGFSLVISAQITRFIIRRLPLIG